MTKKIVFFVSSCLNLDIAFYITTASIVYLIRKISHKLRRENFVVLLCSLCSSFCSIIYLLYELELPGLENIKSNSFICILIITSYRTLFFVSKCFSNFVFARRYKGINSRVSVFALKKAYCYSICIISI